MSEMTLDSSILETVRKLIGGEQNGEAFDTDLIVHINTVFGYLNQLGVGPEEPFFITDGSTTWREFIDGYRFYACLTYMALRVRLLFDTPSSSFVTDAIKEEIRECEWRLTVMHDEDVGY